MLKPWDVIIIGAGASGLMCAIEAGKRGQRVLLLEKSKKAGNKIRMSGGGRCNFTNYGVSAENYLSDNPHFCKSALSRFSQWDFLALVQRYDIPFHERDHGQLFCNESAKDILEMLLSECHQVGVEIRLSSTIQKIEQHPDHFCIDSNRETLHCQSLVIATGGLSIPTTGASPFGYQIAEQFAIPLKPTRAGLVPFTWHANDKQRFACLSGIAINSVVTHALTQFRESLLFTHRGLSGPAILQISSYWQAGEHIEIDLLPDVDLLTHLKQMQQQHPQQQIKTVLNQQLPKRLVSAFIDQTLLEQPLANSRFEQFAMIVEQFKQWRVKPAGTEGYRTAEVTLGGVDTDAISSRTLEAKNSRGLYFIGEVLDVTGELGGYNFQWAWASGWCAGQYV